MGIKSISFHQLLVYAYQVDLSALKDCLESKKFQFLVTFKDFFSAPSKSIRVLYERPIQAPFEYIISNRNQLTN